MGKGEAHDSWAREVDIAPSFVRAFDEAELWKAPWSRGALYLVDSCLQLSAGMAEGRQVKLVKEVPDAPVLIDADARACKQILLNLLSNAVKFSSSGGSVKVSLEVKPDFVRMRVRDKGIGIPADVLPRLGGAFEQAANDPHLAREGTGLGLALVRRLAAAHGGSVHLASTENVGTCVTVELPLRCAERQAA
jgi:cell cycle sensor histidine kinase DivJ